MSPATPWTELTATETLYLNGFVSGTPIDGVIIMGVALPLVGASSVLDATTLWSELTAPSTSSTELSVPSTAWTEITF